MKILNLTCVLGLFLLCRVSTYALVYCNIIAVEPVQLTNGVQITVKADGVLNWRPEGGWREFYSRPDRIIMRFPDAKFKVPNFIDVSLFPVSYIQTSVAPDAKEGVGTRMEIALLAPTRFNVDRSSDQQSVIIMVFSERTLEPREKRITALAEEKESEISVEYKDGLLSVYAIKADIHQLLGTIAQKTGTDIAVDWLQDSKGEARKASINLQNISVEDALRGIASAYGLALSKINNVYMISEGMPRDLAPYHLSGTASFPVKYVPALAASGALPNFLYQYLHVNSEQNSVVVTAPNQMLDKIKTDLEKIDIAPPQIMIEALAVEFASTEDMDLGLGVRWRDKQLENLEDIQTGTAFDSQTGGIFYKTIGSLPENFEARLKALVTAGKARIRARPRMATINGHDANIFIGTQKFILVKYVQWGGIVERIQGVDVGVNLVVTPWTGGSGEITIRVEPKVSNITEIDPASGLPVLSSRQAATTVRVKDGETIAIGGLTLQQEYETKRKIPLLGDIPLIGPLFQSKKTNRVNSELVIFVTPHILTEKGRLPDEKEEKEIRDKFLAPSFEP